MKIEKTVCPYCGANLKIRTGQTTVECEYCGSSVLISGAGTILHDSSPAPAADPVEESLFAEDHSAAESLPAENRPAAESLPAENYSAGAPGYSGADFRQEVPKRRVKHGIFPPPGFRSKNILHMIAVVCGYLFILYAAANLGGIPDFIFFTIASLSVVDLCTEWTGLYSGLKGLRSSNQILRIVMKVIWSVVVFTAWVLVLALVQLIFGM